MEAIPNLSRSYNADLSTLSSNKAFGRYVIQSSSLGIFDFGYKTVSRSQRQNTIVTVLPV